jgi:hypothetical protein
VRWKPWAGGALLVGYVVTFAAGVPATRRTFLDAWFEHRVRAARRDRDTKIPSEELVELRRYAEGVVRVGRVVPLVPGVLMVEYEEGYRDRGVSGRAIALWLPGTVRVILDAA